MITGKQIRAARVLLDWDAEDLAEKAGLNRETVFNIERGTVQARPGSLEKIVKAFNDHRVEFLDDQGVRFRPEDVLVISGVMGIDRFSDLVYGFTKTEGGVIRQMGIEETAFGRCAPEVAAAHRKRMSELVRVKKNIKIRAILKDGDNNFENTDYAEFRWYPQHVPPPVPYYIFGDTVCIFAFEADPSPKIILITSPAISLAYVTQFDAVWKIAKEASRSPLRIKK
jgi:transcriptional regulator with XRE-family HTH domain